MPHGRTDSDQKKAAQQSRALFSYQNQEFVQAFVSKTQYLPDALEVYWNRLKTKCHIVASGNTERYEGIKSAKGNDGYIKGTRTRWPDEEEPFCKYAALFDHREEFDAIRESFIIHNEALSKPSIFATELEKYDVHNTYQDLKKTLQEWLTRSVVDTVPDNFYHCAKSAYLKAIQNQSYYFSTAELVNICIQTKTNIYTHPSGCTQYWAMTHM